MLEQDDQRERGEKETFNQQAYVPQIIKKMKAINYGLLLEICLFKIIRLTFFRK